MTYPRLRLTHSFLLIVFSQTLAFSQQFILLANRANYNAERLLDTSAKFHSSIKPFLWDPSTSDSASAQKKLNFYGTPVLNLGGGSDLIDKRSAFESSGGFWGEGTLFTPKVCYNLHFLSGYSALPAYQDSFIKQSRIIPGMGRAFGTDKTYSYQYFSGYLSYSPNKIFNFQAGKDKNFFGEGYRSLFLSDVANSYPFLKISTTVWKLKYVSLFTWMKDVTAPSHLKKDFLNKYGTFHYLSWNVSKRVNFALFESIIWQGTDSNRVRNYDVNYLNPVIFFRPVEYSLGSSDNACLGGAFKIKVGERYKQQFYGQLILDEFLLKEVLAIFKKIAHPFDNTIKYGWWANKQGVQLGFKSFDLFRVKGLTFQTEINAVRPYTYSHGSVQQNYGHYNQPLAHPLGANFAESVSLLNYQHKRWLFETEFLYALYGKNENGKNYGGNIFESYTTHPNDYGNKFFQGLKTELTYTKFKIGYNLFHLSYLEVGFALRQETNSVSSLRSEYFFIGLHTGLMNRYSDF